MNYVTGKTIKQLREKKKLTQKELADTIHVSDKTISKWETDKGFPDMGIIEDLSKALGVSLAELFTGNCKENENRAGNMRKMQFYICPVCGNIVTSLGKGTFSCCGIPLLEQTGEPCSEDHEICVETVDHEYYISMSHPMDKKHYISFFAYVTSGSMDLVKLYPEQSIEVRFRKKGGGVLYAFCNRHGMFRKIIK